MPDSLGILRFQEQYFERIWGGQRLNTLYGKPIPLDRPIGEAWLVSDHPSAPSVVVEGPHTGKTLHDLVVEDPVGLLGSRSFLTPDGRFPLLLKILDPSDVLSVQVRPDDAMALALHEPDVGKTEMWYVLHADPGAELICGVKSGITKDQMRDAINSGTLEDQLISRTVLPGDSVFVEAGTVHAIGKGIVLAEIQQNSDITYRRYDWNRVDAAGNSRTLHIEKGLTATNLTAEPVWKSKNDASGSLLNLTNSYSIVESRYFNTSRIALTDSTIVHKKGHFLIILLVSGSIFVSSETEKTPLRQGECLLLPACCENITLLGTGEVLLYSPGG